MSRLARKILVVEDEPAIAEVVTTYLSQAGFRVRSAGTVRQALAAAEADTPDLVVLDLSLPDGRGEAVCRQLQRRGDVAIVILTARGREEDVLSGFALGADDYVTKPFSPRELTVRVQAVLRRLLKLLPDPQSSYNAGRLTIDWGRQRIIVNGRSVECTRTEMELLGVLTRSSGRVWSREQLMVRVRGAGHERDVRTVDAHIKKLRAKLEPHPGNPEFIVTVWGSGYRWDGVADG